MRGLPKSDDATSKDKKKPKEEDGFAIDC